MARIDNLSNFLTDVANSIRTKLDPNYIELEYIDSTGTQYIDTGVSGSGVAEIEMSFDGLGSTTGTFEHYLGGDTYGGSTSHFPKVRGDNGGLIIVENYGTIGSTAEAERLDLSITVDDGVVCNGDTINQYNGGPWGSSSLYIFNCHEEPTLMSIMRLYSLTMYTDGEKVREFIPAKRVADEEIGLYDLVTGTFYTNSGTGDFVAGPEVTGIPEKFPPSQFDTKIASINKGIPTPVKGFVYSDYTGTRGFPKQLDLYGNNFPDYFVAMGYDNLTENIFGAHIIQEYPGSYVTKIIIHNEDNYLQVERRTFMYNKNLEDIILPDTVEKIYLVGDAFYNCSKLKSFPISKIYGFRSNLLGTLPAGNFYNCAALESDTLVMPNQITSLGRCVFYGCSKINFTDLNNVTAIGVENGGSLMPTNDSTRGHVFFNCTSLTLSELPEGLTTIQGPNNFEGCTSITISSIPDGVTSLPNYTFRGCTSITTMDTNNVTSIGQYCFNNCTGLTSVEGDACTSIGTYAFNGCTNLTDVSFPSLITINNYAFQNVTSLVNFDFTSVTTINQYVFQGCTGLGSIETKATTLGVYAFAGCTSIINASLTSITTMTNNYVFQNCTSLKNVLLPAIVTFGTTNTYSIFSGCTSLKRVWIGSDVTTINRYAFYGCQSVEVIYIDLPRATVEAMANYSNYKFSNNQLNASVFICNDDQDFISQTDFEALMEADEPVASQGNGE